ncbi:MAG: hypothetical protein WCT14_10575 [Treponemataceae bacterium]
MGTYLDQIPAHLRGHITKIAATSGLAQNEESVELLAHAWLEKIDSFETRIAESDMEEWVEFPAAEARGALILTYSGSLLTVGPQENGTRRVEYASIGLRKDVPESAASDRSVLSKDVRVDESAAFSGGPIEKSSAVFKIAVAKEQLPIEEEKELLSEVTQVLTEDFVELNKTIVVS